MCEEGYHRRGGDRGITCLSYNRTFWTSWFRLSAFVFVLLLVMCGTVLSEDSSKNVISQSEVKTIEPTNNPTKVFVRRRIFRKIVKDNGNNSSEEPPTTTAQPTSTAKPRTLYSLVKRLDAGTTSTVTGSTLKSSMSNSMTLASRQKFNFQSLKTRLGIAAKGIADGTTTEVPSASTSNASLVMIPLPPSQRKPYTPVIMQVSKSTTAKPESTVQTFKLNKMFVPIGIYGKVVENGSDVEVTTGATAPSSSTPVTRIRHKGTDSGEKNGRKHKGIAETVDITYGRPNVDRVSLTTEKPDVSGISITTEINEVFSGLVQGNGVRRRDQASGSRRNQQYSNDAMTLMTPPKLGSGPDESPNTYQDALGSYSSYSNYGSPHKKFSPSSMIDSITDSMSKIPSLVPSLFHKGLTSLTSLTSSLKENPFEDDGFDGDVRGKNQHKTLISGQGSFNSKIPASVPGGYISGVQGGKSGGNRDQAYAASEVKGSGGKSSGVVDMSEYETLEYFRKRPHLLQQIKNQRESAWRRSQGVRFSKGFRPATAPEPLAREYYRTTSTTQETPDAVLNGKRNGKNLRGSWLLRNSNEYVANKNDKVVRMWRDMLESITTDDDPDFEAVYSKIRRMDSNTDQDPASSFLSARRSVASQPSSVLNSEWSTIKRKYSKDQIDEAKERILSLLDSGYGDEALHEIADDEDLQHVHDTSSHMPPPPPPRGISLTKGLSGAARDAFRDLVRFFKLGVSVGAGHSNEPVNYEQIVDEQEGEEAGGSEWKPVRRPLISFSVGMSLKNPSKKPPPPHHHAFSHGIHDDYDDLVTHYSSSSKPYIPNTYKGLSSYEYEIGGAPHSSPVHSISSSTVALKPTPYSYPAEEEVVVEGEQSIDYGDEDDAVGYGSATSAYAAPTSGYYEPASSYSNSKYSTLKPGSSRRPVTLDQNHGDLQHGAASSWQPLTANPNEYELVPSSVYLNGEHDPRDIAAVVKPAGVSDDVVRSVLPAGLRNLRILDYPVGVRGHQTSGGRHSLNSISQVLGKENVGVQGTAFKNAMKKLRENYVAKESAYLPVEDVGFEESSVRGSVAGYSSPLSGYGAGLSQLVNAYAGQDTYRVVGGLGQIGGVSGLGGSYYSPVNTVQSGLVSALSGLEGGNVFSTADRINNLGRGSSVGIGGGAYVQQQGQAQGSQQKDALGFTTNYNLGTNIDPDIAALLKSELDKDDVPDDIRQEFIEAKEQEKKEQAKKQYQAASRRVDNHVDLAQRTLIDSLLSSAVTSTAATVEQYNPTVASVRLQESTRQFVAQQPVQRNVIPTQAAPLVHHHQHQVAQSRLYTVNQNGGGVPAPPAPPVVQTRFFAPIPITPTLMTTALKNPRYASPVPRYVIELAKKLQGDRSVQGIVRVSAKRGRGLPPIEYLYPVKG